MMADTSSGWALRRLKGMWLFHDVPDDALAHLAEGARERTLASGEVLLREGEEGDDLFVVVDGALRITQTAPDGAEVLLGEARKGEYLGELALLGHRPRTATATAIADSRLLCVSRQGFQACLGTYPSAGSALHRLDESRRAWAASRRLRPPPNVIVEAFRRFFPEVSGEQAATLVDEVEWLTVPRGAWLFRQGEPGDAVYFVMRGALKVVAEGDDIKEVRLGDVGPGEPVGEMALLSGEARMASARVEEDADLLRLSRVGFEHLLAAQPKTMGVFARAMASRLAKATRGRSAVPQLRATQLVSVEECEAAVSLADPVMLNLTITQLYHRVAIDLTVLLGAQDVNWFGFACRASKTAGRSIRGETLPLRQLLLRTPFWPWLERSAAVARQTAWLRRFEDAVDTVAERVAQGNRAIFGEIGPAFVRLVRTFASDTTYDRTKLDGLLASMKPGPTESGGQDLLKEALVAYYEATFETSPKRRAELILLGSLKIGMHEQIRVDPIIDAALDAPLEVFFDELLASLPRPVRAGAKLGRPGLQRRVRHALTRRMMRMQLPDVELALGEDVPAWGRQQPWPPMLEHLENPELRPLFDRIVGGSPSRAHDWSELGDRMRFIAVLFRSRQKSLQLFEPPYLEAQNAEIRARQVPDGAL